MTIYFIRAVDCGRIKIGYTGDSDPAKRLASMSTGCPSELEVLAYCSGEEAREGQLHEIMAATRARGEWFKPSKRLEGLIKYAKQNGTTAGWEESEIGEDKWAALTEEFLVSKCQYVEDPDHADVRWNRSLESEHQKTPQMKDRFYWDELNLQAFYMFDGERSLNLQVAHSIQEFEDDDSEFGWLVDGVASCGTKASAQTAESLAEAKNPEEVMAIWIGACIHEITNVRRGDQLSAIARVPGIVRLQVAVRERIRGWWNRMSVGATPLPFVLPERCLLTDNEFVHMASRHMHANLRRFTPYARWKIAAGCWLPVDRKAVAA